MSPGALGALVRLELLRARPAALRLFTFVAGAAAVMSLAGWATAARLGVFLLLAGFTLVAYVPTSILRDKLDGGMEFLVSLPTPASTLAAGRLLAVVVACVPGAAALWAGLLLVTPVPVWAVPGGPWNVLLGMWLLTTVAMVVLVGVTLRIRVEHTGAIFITFFVLSTAVDELVPRLLPDPLATARRLWTAPWAPLALWILGVTLVAGAVVVGFRLARTGFERFTPGRDRISW